MLVASIFSFSSNLSILSKKKFTILASLNLFSANAINLNQAKILLIGKELMKK